MENNITVSQEREDEHGQDHHPRRLGAVHVAPRFVGYALVGRDRVDATAELAVKGHEQQPEHVEGGHEDRRHAEHEDQAGDDQAPGATAKGIAMPPMITPNSRSVRGFWSSQELMLCRLVSF